MVLRALCVLFVAVPAFAGGITSWEPDTTARQGPRIHEPMVETPVWYGLTYSMSSLYERSLNGFTGAPRHFSVIATGVTWPWRSRLQGWSEFSYMVRTLYDERTYRPYWNPGTAYVDRYETNLDMLGVRGGVEYRFGTRGLPWCTAGAGLGMGFAFGDEPAAATEVLARVTCFLYPSGHTRLGLMLSGGPAWVATPGTYYLYSYSGDEQDVGTRTHYELGLRIESRLRFPVANAD